MSGTAPTSNPVRVDRFGFPISWAIEFRRLMVDFRGAVAQWSQAERDEMAATTRRIDLEAAAIADLGQGRGPDARTGSVLWVIPFPVTTGGMRVQVELARALTTRGWRVTLVLLRGGQRDQLDLPDNFAHVVTFNGHDDLVASVDVREFDLVVAGCWVDYLPLVRSGARRVLGYSGGEPTINESEGFDASFLDYRSAAHALPVHLVTCSRFVQCRYSSAMHRNSVYVPAALHDYAFDVRSLPRKRSDRFRVLVLARDGVVNKGLQYALPALRRLQDEGMPLDIVWITPSAPEIFTDLACELHIDPPKRELFETVRSCHALVYTPLVDGLGLPPLEAMAAGTPVVLTPTGGASEFAEPDVNCLQVPIGDTEAIAHAVRRLHEDSGLRERLAGAGTSTAATYERTRTENQFASVMERLLSSDPIKSRP